MDSIQVNYVAVLVCAVVTFLLGGLWYSPVLFAKRWVALVGLTEEQMKKGGSPTMYVIGFLSGLISCYLLAHFFQFSGVSTLIDGAMVGFVCWVGFTGATTYNNQVNFVGKPVTLWAIDSGYNLVSFVVSGAVFAIWK